MAISPPKGTLPAAKDGWHEVLKAVILEMNTDD